MLTLGNYIPIHYLPHEKGERTFEFYKDCNYHLPDGRVITIPKGFKTDLISMPTWFWSIFKPFDKALIGDIVHDYLWVHRVEEITRFKGDIHKARRYSDNIRLQIRQQIAPEKFIKNYLTHYFLRIFGGLYYSRQLKIPLL